MDNDECIIYEKGDALKVSFIFGDGNFAESLNKAEYISQIENYDKKMYEHLIEIRQEIEDKEGVLKEEKRSVNNKLMDYTRNPSSSKDVGDVARVAYDNIQNNPDADMNIQTKPVDNNKTQPAVNKNISLDDAEQRTMKRIGNNT